MNFKDAYKEELELYNPEASAERLKEIKRQEERRKDIKAIPYFIGAILLVLFIWWLCSERTEKISKTYEGYFVSDEYLITKNECSIPEDAHTITVAGDVTYSSKLSKKIVALYLTVTLKDKNGKIIFEYTKKSTCDFGDSKDGFIGLSEWILKDGAYTDCVTIGLVYFNEDFKEFVMYLLEDTTLYGNKGPYFFAAPADNAHKAYEIYCNMFDIPIN